ncbi:hypothetical protein O9993_09035 [Vibrio lentus]|nr:hypothetical protein [Vibrio lentus]
MPNVIYITELKFTPRRLLGTIYIKEKTQLWQRTSQQLITHLEPRITPVWYGDAALLRETITVTGLQLHSIASMRSRYFFYCRGQFLTVKAFKCVYSYRELVRKKQNGTLNGTDLNEYQFR